MLKKAKTGKVGTRIMAWFMTVAMLLSLVGVMPEPIWAEDEAITSWDFSEYTGAYEGESEVIDWNTLKIDTTGGGKCAQHAGNCCAQFNGGAKIQVPVSGSSVITVTPHKGEGQYAKYTINGMAASIEDSATSIIYEGEAGYVDIVAPTTGDSYISKIEVSPIQTNWDFGTFTTADEINGKVGVWNSLVVDATAENAKVATNGDNYCIAFNTGTIIKVPVTGACEIKITAHSVGYAEYDVKMGDTSVSANTEDVVTTVEYDGEAGFVELTATAQSYLVSIAVENKEVEEDESVESVYILNADDLTAETVATAYKAGTNNYFTLNKNLVIDSNKKTFTVGTESITVSQRIKSNGDSSLTEKSIGFVVSAGMAANIYVCVASSNGSNDAQLVLLDADGNVVNGTINKIIGGEHTTILLEGIEAGTYYLASKKATTVETVGANVNFYYVKVTETVASTQPKVLSVTASQDVTDESGATVTVSFTGKAGGENSAYTVEASKDGENWIKLGTVDGTNAEGSLEVNLCKKDLGFGTWKFRVKGSNTVEAENSIVYAAKTYTLSGTYNTGLEDASILTGLTFTATTDSIYTVPEVTFDTTNKTYSVVLEQGTTYKVEGIGVDEYDMLTPSGAITYYEDTTLNLEFNKKVFYDVTISLGSTPDLSEKDIIYTFTHADGAVYEFEAGEAIQLRDGVYTVAIGGDFEQMAYAIKTGGTLTVAGAAVNHVITFTERTSWTFLEDYAAKYPNSIQSTTAWYNGLFVDATNGKLRPNNNSAQMAAGTIIEVPVNGPCSITVTAYQASMAKYTINGVQASTDNASTTIEYAGEAGTIQIVSTDDGAYIASIAVTYAAKEVETEDQPVMPFVPETDGDSLTELDTDDVPRGNKEDSITVQPEGQKLVISQAGGDAAGKYTEIGNLGYYLFPMTTDNNRLEFDIVIQSAGGDNGDGAFIGLFTNDYMYTLGIRKGTNPRAIYSKEVVGTDGRFADAGGINNSLELGEPLYVVVEYVEGKPTITYTRLNTGEKATASMSILETTEEGFYYGLIVSDATVVITNMLYTSADGKTVYYNQNDCYHPEGTAPVASNVTAVGAETREYIDISWTGTVPEYDGTYVVEMQKDGGEWVELTQDVTGFTYRYVLPAGDGGNYKFRVCGQLGKESLGGERNNYATMDSTTYVKGALEKPVVEVEEKDGKIVVTWQEIAGAEYYVVYRYSSDQGVEGAVCVAERLTTNTYIDASVEVDVPYYYYVKAVTDTDDNESPYSEIVWTVVASEREGDYAQEKEATGIVITKKSYDTVFKNKVVLEGVVYGKGTLTAIVNGVKATSKEVNARDKFAFELAVVEGRNDVNLFFEDADGNITRKTFNFVYLTNYDVIVDTSYTGTDGELVDGIPTFKTVQAAVDAAGATSTLADEAGRTVILVMAGSYEERLVVNTPNITLIGEDRENTLIHFYPGVLGEDYEAGGDMKLRCATYIQSGATGFTAENISFANDFVYSSDSRSNKSADAIRVDADQAVFVNVGMKGVQDTLYMDAGKQYYYKCEIKGLIDFIYSGEKARSYFNDCEIIFVYEPTKNSGYVCAPKTAADATYGLTFNNCVITAEEGCTGSSYLLARPWGENAYITWINCYMGDVIYPYNPYNSMSGNMAEDARFYEYGTYGPGYMINETRRQISPEQAKTMTSADFLGWNPTDVTSTLSSSNYVGTIETDRENYATAEAVEDEYLWTDGDDTGLKMYDQEGYADAYGVTGGGLLKETNGNYYKVDTAEAFLNALLAAKNGRQNTVIELTADINLGSNEIENYASYSDIIKAYSNQPLTHPTLIKSGVSQLTFNNICNLTIFSQNGASIKHANITMKKCENIIIRNIKFDELWEWDEATHGDYDRNDWDYVTIDDATNGIWIDHCTFYKAYDGIIDVKNPVNVANITISWCEFLPGSEDDTFFDAMMDEIKANEEDYPYYKELKEAGMTEKQIYKYAYFQKKTHLFGQDDSATNAASIRVTLANNYYLNSMDRMPRLRYGYTHVYNCVMDSQDILKVRLALGDSPLASKFVSNGAASTCGAQVLLENCYIRGIQNALNSGNGSSPAGYINAINSLYYMNGKLTTLAPKNNTTADDDVLITDAEDFIAGLPYSDYTLYDAEDLRGIIPFYAGAGKLKLTVLQWEKTSYNAEWKAPIVHETGDLMDTTVVFMITLLGAAFVTAGFFVKKKFATEE